MYYPILALHLGVSGRVFFVEFVSFPIQKFNLVFDWDPIAYYVKCIAYCIF